MNFKLELCPNPKRSALQIGSMTKHQIVELSGGNSLSVMLTLVRIIGGLGSWGFPGDGHCLDGLQYFVVKALKHFIFAWLQVMRSEILPASDFLVSQFFRDSKCYWWFVVNIFVCLPTEVHLLELGVNDFLHLLSQPLVREAQEEIFNFSLFVFCRLFASIYHN